MVVSNSMEPLTTHLEGNVVATLRVGRVSASLVRFDAEAQYGFRFWRWSKFKDGWKRAQLFQAADIEPLSLLLSRIEQEPLLSPPSSKTLPFDLQEHLPKNVVSVVTTNSVQAVISDPQKPKHVAPFFTLRKLVPGARESANWFYTSDVPDLQSTLEQVSAWYRSNLDQ